MDDRLLASRAGSGDLDSFGQLYDRYFHRVYDFAYRVLGDGDAAADVTRTTFMRTLADLPSLAKSGNLAASLFTSARRQALDRAPALARTAIGFGMHEEAFGSFAVPDASRIDRPEMVGGDHELATLVWEAMSALNAPDYALLDLHIRQGLDSAELARVLNVSKRDAATIVSRMKVAATGVVAGYVVARRGAVDCAELQNVLAPFSLPPYTDSIRRAVDQHIAGCRICQRTRDGIRVEPLAVLGAFAAVGAPVSLKSDIWRELSAAWNVAPRMTLAGAASGAERMPLPYAGASVIGAAAAGGAPPPPGAGFGRGGDRGLRPGPAAMPDGSWDRNRILWFGGGAVVLLVLAFGAAAAVRAALDNGNGGGSGGSVATRTAGPTRTATAGGTPAGIGVTTPTAAPTASPTVGPTETATLPPPPTELPATATPVPQNTPIPRTTPTTAPARTATPKPGRTATATKCPSGICPTVTP
jgi:RNA polymerase sigma factor (sigma-70 family)